MRMKKKQHDHSELSHHTVVATHEGSTDIMTATNDRSQVPATSVTTWQIDPRASRVEFTARMRLMFVMKVTILGRFSNVAGTLTVDEREPTNSHVTVTIGTASLDTKLAARDQHLHSADFFDVEHYPTMTFTSQRIETLDQAAGHYRVAGTLTIREATREVSLDAWNVPPRMADDSRLTFTLTMVLDRRDWGLTWSRPIQQIADEVNLVLTVQFVPVSSAV
jgi:polyisoprenoid-binding protein YceI